MFVRFAILLLLGVPSVALKHQDRSSGSDFIKKYTDENAELRAQNEELLRENSLLKAKEEQLEKKLEKEKKKVKQVDKSHQLKDVHGVTKLHVCEQQVRDLSEGLVEHGETQRLQEIHEKALRSQKHLEEEMKEDSRLRGPPPSA